MCTRYLLLIFLAGSVSAESYVFVKEGRIVAGPRDLPSVGVRLDTGQPVLGLHGASDSARAACGWYRVIPDTAKAASNQVAGAASYTIGKDAVQEKLAFVERRVVTPQVRLAAILDSLPGETDDARVSALIKAVATCVTGRIDTAVTIIVPAKEKGLK